MRTKYVCKVSSYKALYYYVIVSTTTQVARIELHFLRLDLNRKRISTHVTRYLNSNQNSMYMYAYNVIFLLKIYFHLLTNSFVVKGIGWFEKYIIVVRMRQPFQQVCNHLFFGMLVRHGWFGILEFFFGKPYLHFTLSMGLGQNISCNCRR